MSSESSTNPADAGRDSGIQPWHFYLLLSMAGATWAVIVARDTHPVALVLLSAAIVAAGFVGAALHQALLGFFGETVVPPPAKGSLRDELEREKALVLRSLKELEFDRSMRKISDADYAEIGGRLRTRAMELMEQLEGASSRPATAAMSKNQPTPTLSAPPEVVATGRCAACGTGNDADARFCKSCGARLA